VAPDHEYPSSLELRLTATDSDNNVVTVSRRLDPRTVSLTATSDPPGMTVSTGPDTGAAPVTSTVIEGSANTINAPSPQVKDNTSYEFSSWSDGQAQTHNVAPTTSTTYTARFAPRAPGTSTLVFNAEADAYVEEASPAANFGSAVALRTDGGADPEQETYIRFLVDGLEGRVQSAKLRLFSVTNTSNGPAVFPTSNAWSETTLNWSNRPAPTGGALSDAGTIATGVWTEWDVAPAVTSDGQVSFRLANSVSDGVFFDSRESASVNRRPELVLTVLNDAYARPKGATPTRVPLVPAFGACASPNRVHGPPLASAACNPPAQSSSQLTVGTFDANGEQPNSSGSVSLAVLPGVPSTPEDEADVAIRLALTDVRDKAGLADYTGELQVRGTLRVTDRASGAAGADAGTVQDLDLPVTAGCAPTADTAVGATCGVVTTLDALTPGAVDEGARAVWQLAQVQVFDGGPDGDVDTPGNTVFLRQGLFIP